MAIAVSAADKFVVFQPSADALLLNNSGIAFDSREHSCVQLAIANLKQDFERVTGKKGLNGDANTIIIGTVGTNKQIDQWVKKGILRDLKGKTEKYIIKTIDGQLVAISEAPSLVSMSSQSRWVCLLGITGLMCL